MSPFFNTTPDRAGPTPEQVSLALSAVEAELVRTKIAEVPAPTADAIAQAGAFGQPTLAFEQLLVHVFVPNVRRLIDAGGPFPHKSQVADQAFREWRMWGDAPDVDVLIDRLRAFDALFTQ